MRLCKGVALLMLPERDLNPYLPDQSGALPMVVFIPTYAIRDAFGSLLKNEAHSFSYPNITPALVKCHRLTI